jgi:prepilin-type N-terminal cleavage/methylation domain-containing protein
MQLFLNKNSGFTLIELLVAIASFVVIISIAVGGFSGALRSQRQAIALMNANNNISLVLEQMMREIRTGSNFCQSSNPCSSNVLSFTNAYGRNVSYRLNNNAIEKDNGSGFKKITADNVVVRYLNFIYSGTLPNDNKQPKIAILIGVSSRESSASGIVVNLQTTVSPRILDS